MATAPMPWAAMSCQSNQRRYSSGVKVCMYSVPPVIARVMRVKRMSIGPGTAFHWRRRCQSKAITNTIVAAMIMCTAKSKSLKVSHIVSMKGVGTSIIHTTTSRYARVNVQRGNEAKKFFNLWFVFCGWAGVLYGRPYRTGWRPRTGGHSRWEWTKDARRLAAAPLGALPKTPCSLTAEVCRADGAASAPTYFRMPSSFLAMMSR